ncbi:MAG TPA: condensation domain-containing protein [Pyrinomonadaceae bacterium]|jgi:hypothetical protein
MDKPGSGNSREQLLSRKAALSPAQRALLERRLGGSLQGSREEPAASRIEPVPRDGDLPLTLIEESIFAECLAKTDGGSNLARAADGSNLRTNLSKFCRLSGPFDKAAMEQAVSDLARRHEALRMRFALVDAKPTRRIEPSLSPALPVIDLEHLPEGQRLEAALEIASEEATRPFELDGGLLWRIVLLRLRADDHLLLMVLDHCVSDDWSMNLLVRDTWALYHSRATGSPAPLAELPIQFADYAYWQRRVLQGAALDRLVSYWRRQLDGMGPLPEIRLPIELPSPDLPDIRPAATLSSVLSPELSDSLRALAREKNVTLQMTMISSLLALLHLYTGEHDLGIRVLSAKRYRPEVREVVGCFTDYEVLRASVFGGDTFSDLLLRVRDAAVEAQEHSDLPSVMYPGHEPCSDEESFPPGVTVNMLPREARPPGLPRRRGDASTLSPLIVTPMASPRSGSPARKRPGLTLLTGESNEGLRLVLNYTIERYEASAVGEFLHNYRVTLVRVAANPQARLSDLPVSITRGPTA